MQWTYAHTLAARFILSGCLLGALCGYVWTLRPVRGERRG